MKSKTKGHDCVYEPQRLPFFRDHLIKGGSVVRKLDEPDEELSRAVQDSIYFDSYNLELYVLLYRPRLEESGIVEACHDSPEPEK